jgi:hypothetical protein
MHKVSFSLSYAYCKISSLCHQINLQVFVNWLINFTLQLHFNYATTGIYDEKYTHTEQLSEYAVHISQFESLVWITTFLVKKSTKTALWKYNFPPPTTPPNDLYISRGGGGGASCRKESLTRSHAHAHTFTSSIYWDGNMATFPRARSVHPQQPRRDSLTRWFCVDKTNKTKNVIICCHITVDPITPAPWNDVSHFGVLLNRSCCLMLPSLNVLVRRLLRKWHRSFHPSGARHSLKGYMYIYIKLSHAADIGWFLLFSLRSEWESRKAAHFKWY